MKQQPQRDPREIAAQVGCSIRSVYRWVAEFEAEGIAAFGATISPGSDTHGAPDFADETGIPCATWFVDLLQALPWRGTTMEWIEVFRQRLQSVLPDVDRVTVDVNVSCFAVAADGDERTTSSKANIRVTHHFADGPGADPSIVLRSGREMSTPLLQDMIEGGFPVHEYRAPRWVEYRNEEGDYLGTIILWRRRDAREMSDEPLRVLGGLRAVIVFLLTDCAARHQALHPVNHSFYGALDEMARTKGLTERERTVALMLLLGQSYDEIAGVLAISRETVARHATSVHRKTGTRSTVDLNAKYFTPRLKK